MLRRIEGKFPTPLGTPIPVRIAPPKNAIPRPRNDPRISRKRRLSQANGRQMNFSVNFRRKCDRMLPSINHNLGGFLSVPFPHSIVRNPLRGLPPDVPILAETMTVFESIRISVARKSACSVRMVPNSVSFPLAKLSLKLKHKIWILCQNFLEYCKVACVDHGRLWPFS